MMAKINNKFLKVEIINPNYNEHAMEVKILEGAFTGKYCIVEKADIVLPKMSLTQLVKMVKNEIENMKDLEGNHFIELISKETIVTILHNISSLVSINSKESDIFKYNYYRTEYHDINYVKQSILFDTIESLLTGIKATIAGTKRKFLLECMD